MPLGTGYAWWTVHTVSDNSRFFEEISWDFTPLFTPSSGLQAVLLLTKRNTEILLQGRPLPKQRTIQNLCTVCTKILLTVTESSFERNLEGPGCALCCVRDQEDKTQP